jgi:hypothetical protein
MAAMDVSPRLLFGLIGAIYDCALDPSRWEKALGEMVRRWIATTRCCR